jgi:hypothetical protein
MNKPEFNLEDIVHFRAYKDQPEEGIKAKVKGIKHGSGGNGKSFITGEPDDRYFYRMHLLLTEDQREKEVRFFDLRDLPETTGLSIIESKHFKEPTE